MKARCAVLVATGLIACKSNDITENVLAPVADAGVAEASAEAGGACNVPQQGLPAGKVTLTGSTAYDLQAVPTVDGFAAVINEAPASDLQLWFTSTSNVCADNLAGVEHQGGTAFVLDLGFGPGVPIAAGNVYESGLDAGVPSSGNSIGLYSFSGPNCQYTAGGPNVDTASITVDTITQTRLQGSFQVQAGPDTLQGTFDLPICPSNASMMAGNATTCCP